MANGGSRAPYIIICQGRIDIALAKNGFEMIQAASRCAAALATYYGERLSDADTLPISGLQHDMMELVQSRAIARTRQQPLSADEMVDQMFALLDALEEKMES